MNPTPPQTDSPTPELKQEFLDAILARAKNSNFGLHDEPKSPVNFDHYTQKNFESAAMILVNAFESKYDLVAILKATMDELHQQNTSLREQVENMKHDLNGFLFNYQELMKVAPWSESNDMDIADEFNYGLTGLIQQRDDALLANARLVEAINNFIEIDIKELSSRDTNDCHDVPDTSRLIVALSTNPDTNQNLVVVEKGELERLKANQIMKRTVIVNGHPFEVQTTLNMTFGNLKEEALKQEKQWNVSNDNWLIQLQDGSYANEKELQSTVGGGLFVTLKAGVGA